MMNLPAYLYVPLLVIIAATANAQDAPVAVTCEQDVYALCAYAKCTMNSDMKTADCPCYSLSGPSLARIDVIPDADIKLATMNGCTDATCWRKNEAPICSAITDGSLWPGADAISTFSRELEIENGVVLDENEARAPSWTCAAPEGGRLVPNCMLAPCRSIEPVTNSYFHGEATMKCTCPLIRVKKNYSISGGLQDPCDSNTFVNTGGAVLANHAEDDAAVTSAWEAVAVEFGSVDSAKVEDDGMFMSYESSGTSLMLGTMWYMMAAILMKGGYLLY